MLSMKTGSKIAYMQFGTRIECKHQSFFIGTSITSCNKMNSRKLITFIIIKDCSKQ